MMHLSSFDMVILALTFIVAGLVKGVTGMGLPTVAMGVLGAFMPPAMAATLLIVPASVTNIWQLVTGPNFAGLITRLWLMMIGIAVGTVSGSWFLTSVDATWATVGLGAVLAAYGIISLLMRPLHVPAQTERWLSPLAGLATGLVTGATGVAVIPSVPYLQALGLGKDDLVQALGLSFTISTIALAIGLMSGGVFHIDNLIASAVAILPAVLGMWLGTLVREWISAATFRRWFLICLIMLGFDLMLRPFL